AYNKIGEENDRVDDAVSRTWNKFTYLVRGHSYYDLTDSLSIEGGSTLSYTPEVNGNEDRSLVGVDLTFRHKPLVPGVYQGATLAGELFTNSERLEQPAGNFERQIAVGGYGYAQVDFDPGILGTWSAGFMVDSAPDIASPGKKTTSYSPYLNWWPSEFNRVRLQYTYGDDEVGEDEGESGSQVFLQWTTILGSHTHGFRNR
ncbi:MAG: hypothetical protein GTO40_25740, partial [Deltaproteobacteria bacterium]|nr:hypothetical protein [Deltaproteobacteria bacterium]